MSTPPLHPAIVHLPLGLALVLPLVALGLTLALWRGRWPMGVWSIVVGLQLSGEQGLPGVRQPHQGSMELGTGGSALTAT